MAAVDASGLFVSTQTTDTEHTPQQSEEGAHIEFGEFHGVTGESRTPFGYRGHHELNREPRTTYPPNVRSPSRHEHVGIGGFNFVGVDLALDHHHGHRDFLLLLFRLVRKEAIQHVTGQ